MSTEAPFLTTPCLTALLAPPSVGYLIEAPGSDPPQRAEGQGELDVRIPHSNQNCSRCLQLRPKRAKLISKMALFGRMCMRIGRCCLIWGFREQKQNPKWPSPKGGPGPFIKSLTEGVVKRVVKRGVVKNGVSFDNPLDEPIRP